MKHTPGPWSYQKTKEFPPEYQIEYVAEDEAGTEYAGILAIVKEGHGENGTKANAVLIAAAPELLAALELILEDLREWAKYNGEAPLDELEKCNAQTEMVVAVIAKAKGEI